jgi:cytochrome b
MIKVWDLLVRIFHWSLVASFAIAWVSAESLDALHEWAGYAAGALICMRLVWGVIGTRYARFTNFVKGPTAVMAYAKAMIVGAEPRFIGHNPAGGAMILALLFSVAITTWTGWLQTFPETVQQSWAEGAHEFAANLTLFLVVLHIAGVVVASWRHRENLARAMFTGKKRDAEAGDVS